MSNVVAHPVCHAVEGPEGQEGGEVGLVLQGQEVYHGGMLEVAALAPLVQVFEDLVALVTCKESSVDVTLREDCLTFELLPMVALLDHMEPLEPPLQTGPDPTQVLEHVIAGVQEDSV